MKQIKSLTARRGLSLLLALSLLMILAGCGGQEADTTTEQPGQPRTQEPADASPEPTPEPEPDPVKLALEQDTTFGISFALIFKYDVHNVADVLPIQLQKPLPDQLSGHVLTVDPDALPPAGTVSAISST